MQIWILLKISVYLCVCVLTHVGKSQLGQRDSTARCAELLCTDVIQRRGKSFLIIPEYDSPFEMLFTHFESINFKCNVVALENKSEMKIAFRKIDFNLKRENFVVFPYISPLKWHFIRSNVNDVFEKKRSLFYAEALWDRWKKIK